MLVPDGFSTQLPSFRFDSPTRKVESGMTVEQLARDEYGDDWRTGVGAIMAENRVRLNANGSPVLGVGQEVRLPGLEGYGAAERGRLQAGAGQMIASNEARLTESRRQADAARRLEGTLYEGLSGDDLARAVATSYRESLADGERRALAGALVAEKFVPRSQWGARPPISGRLEKPEGPYNTVTLHHTGLLNQTPSSVQSLHLGDENWWRGRTGGLLETYPEYGDVGYNYMVGKDGAIYEGRSTDVQGAHVSGHNRGNIGVAALGDYSNKPLTPAQLASVSALVTTLQSRYPIKDVATHGEFDQKRKDEMRGAMPQLKDFLQ